MASNIFTTLEDIQRLPLTRLNLNEIRPKKWDYSDRYVQGRIKQTGTFINHVKLPIQYRILYIEESETRECMQVVLQVNRDDENVASQRSFLKEDNLRINDILVIINFKIETNPLFPAYDKSHMFRAVVNLSLVGSKIMVVRSECDSDQRKGQHQNASSVSILPTPSLSKSKSQQKDSYVYVKLRDLTPGTIVNIIGCVKYVKEATKSRGTDYCMVITIVDETRNSTISKLKCSLLGSLETLPRVKLEQIIRFHRLKISTFGDGLQGQRGPGFSWVVFDETVDAPLAPISASSKNFTLTEDVEEMVKQLRLWAESEDITLSQDSIAPYKQPIAPYKQLYPSLSDINLDQYFDLICQVVGKCIIVEGQSMLFKIWDGTEVKMKLYEQVMTDDLASRFQLWEPLSRLAHSYIVDVFVYDNHFYSAAKVEPGDFIKLRNLHFYRPKSRLGENATHGSLSPEICLHQGTSYSYNRGLTILESTSAEAVELKRRLDRVLSENDYSFDSAEEHWMETAAASSSGRCNQATVAATAQVMSIPEHESGLDSICEESSEEFFTPSLSSGNFRVLLSKTPVVAADSFEEDVRIEVTDLAENEENLPPNSRNSTSKNVSPCAGEVAQKKRKFHFSKSSLEGKENTKVDESEAVGSHNAGTVSTTGSQCSIESSHDFATDRCMLTTATVLIGHSHVAVTRVKKIKERAHPNKFRFQGYAINYMPNSETVDGFLRLYCERCNFSSPVPSSEECLSLNLSQLSGSIREPEFKCTDNGIGIYSCPHCSADLEYIFMVEFILNDGTDWLHAELWRQEANNFFGCTPLDLLRNPGAYKEIKEKLNIMCFGLKTCKNVDRLSNVDKSDASLMECCLMSYRVPCGFAYQIFDTMFAVTS